MALKGITVLELAGLVPAPFCGMILADFGASVISVNKINSNMELDCLLNGKRSLCLNIKHPRGADVLKKLSKNSDVLIEPFRKGVMENLGLGPDILLKENPKLIYARLTGFGQAGPYSSRAGHDINFIALSGLLSLMGRHDGNPAFPVNLAADFGGGGLMCALGIILALFERSNSNLGQVVDNSMVEGTSYLGSWLYKSQSLHIWDQERGKNILDGGAHFYEVYKTKDEKYVSVGAIEPQFYNNLLKGLGISENEAPQFGDFDKLKRLFEQRFLEKTRDEWCHIFDTLDACVTPVLSLKEAPNFKHTSDSFVKANDCFVPKPAPRLSRTPGVTSSLKKPPFKGEHTKEILKELNISDEEIYQLEKDDVIVCHKHSKL